MIVKNKNFFFIYRIFEVSLSENLKMMLKDILLFLLTSIFSLK